MPCKKKLLGNKKIIQKMKAGKPKHGLVEKYKSERPLKKPIKLEGIKSIGKIRGY